ncbi:Spc34p NDAI_0B05200 [Naumovozyma dairenensis CBS 421]|uniref:DASH complex subunit SPC34 n=1 Tax=Naumovozyma dairenensis (strain ATCC 10597 / BCRC 20456 / CBS 421 / NBRC 0211 / NRRL Y-12639) TaxID=1071378 RepID=G0W6Z2_NAUDC|nr:hypothetical protein NDAI_0B05200 [Naumovozyma dairenensis CBS 421]CCD23553.1 hypothetical protein NDAI_0B05200 [Naumovozyma dairenensis CBS 421]
MKESLDSCIREINQATESISTLYFKPPGIFHNAVVHNIVNKGSNEYKSNLTKLIRDCNPKEEVSLFKVDKVKKTIKRKDGQEGIFDYLSERNANIKRNRRIGIPGEKPIIHVPKEFYLKQHNRELTDKKRRTTNNLLFNMDNKSSKVGSVDSGSLEILLNKFKNNKQILNLLYALQNGSVMVENDSIMPNQFVADKRKTMFVEDFSPELILEVLDEIAKQWPLAEYRESYNELQERYLDLKAKIDVARKEADLQEEQLDIQSKSSSMASSNAVTKLIEKERNNIMTLEEKIRKLEADKDIQEP